MSYDNGRIMTCLLNSDSIAQLDRPSYTKLETNLFTNVNNNPERNSSS